MIAVLDRMFQPQGYNIGLNQGKSAGAGLPGHLHWHVVPRWDGDTNFMPILAGSKVIDRKFARILRPDHRGDWSRARVTRDGGLGGFGNIK